MAGFSSKGVLSCMLVITQHQSVCHLAIQLPAAVDNDRFILQSTILASPVTLPELVRFMGGGALKKGVGVDVIQDMCKKQSIQECFVH